MIAQSVFIGKQKDPDYWTVRGVLTTAYKDNKVYFCVGTFNEPYLKEDRLIWRRNKTIIRGKYGTPFNDGSKYIRWIADDTYTTLLSRVEYANDTSFSLTPYAYNFDSFDQISTSMASGTNLFIWSVKREAIRNKDAQLYLSPNDEDNWLLSPPIKGNTLSEIHFPGIEDKAGRVLILAAIEKCMALLLSEVLLATTDYHFKYDGEWDFLKEGAV